MDKKKAFGGYAISFKGCEQTMEEVFGTKDLTPPEMTKRAWNFIKANKLANK